MAGELPAPAIASGAALEGVGAAAAAAAVARGGGKCWLQSVPNNFTKVLSLRLNAIES